MTCQLCGLPDIHRGQGDGIGSCDCPRCECCRAAPYDCDCNQDIDERDLEPDQQLDYLCNDPGCGHLQLRLASRERAS